MNQKTINEYGHILYENTNLEGEEQFKRIEEYYSFMNKRRSIREFSNKAVPKNIIETIIKTASTAPSGAHKQPWTFCAISNSEVKKEIRIAAEKEELENYENRMSDRWKNDLKPFGTDHHKPFLEVAPWLIIVFKQAYGLNNKGEKENHYYVNESVGIACGLLISAIHQAGLISLTHTPSPMNFLSKICNRPENERPFLLLPVGYPADSVYVPDITRKTLDDVAVFFE